MADEALILAWVRRTLGPEAKTLDERATRHGQTRVACILDAVNRPLGWWKRAATIDAARREVEALRAVAGVAPDSVPELLDHDPSRGWLLLRHVAAHPWQLDMAASTPDIALAVGRAARLGRWRRLLDTIVVPPDPLPMDEAIAARREAWVEHAKDVLDPSMIEGLIARVEPTRFAGERRGLCHRDLDPHNVIWVRKDREDGEAPVVLDFGQARADHPLVDGVRLRVTAFAEDDASFDAFVFAWRGRALDADEKGRFDSLLALEILGTAVWAERHGDDVFRGRAQRAWRRLLRG